MYFTGQGPESMLSYTLRMKQDGEEYVVSSPMLAGSEWRAESQDAAIRAAKAGLQAEYEKLTIAREPKWMRDAKATRQLRPSNSKGGW